MVFSCIQGKYPLRGGLLQRAGTKCGYVLSYAGANWLVNNMNTTMGDVNEILLQLQTNKYCYTHNPGLILPATDVKNTLRNHYLFNRTDDEGLIGTNLELAKQHDPNEISQPKLTLVTFYFNLHKLGLQKDHMNGINYS